MDKTTQWDIPELDNVELYYIGDIKYQFDVFNVMIYLKIIFLY